MWLVVGWTIKTDQRLKSWNRIGAEWRSPDSRRAIQSQAKCPGVLGNENWENASDEHYWADAEGVGSPNPVWSEKGWAVTVIRRLLYTEQYNRTELLSSIDHGDTYWFSPWCDGVSTLNTIRGQWQMEVADEGLKKYRLRRAMAYLGS